MPTTLEELIPIIDEARSIATDIGWYTREVVVVTRTWSGMRRQHGDPTLADQFTIDPRPRVADATLTRINRDAGMVEDGDLYVRGVSARYTIAELTGVGLVADNEERLYRVTTVQNGYEDAVPVATTGLCRLVWSWKRGDPLGWTLLLRPVTA